MKKLIATVAVTYAVTLGFASIGWADSDPVVQPTPVVVPDGDMGFDPGHPMPERPEFRVNQDQSESVRVMTALSGLYLDLSRPNSIGGSFSVDSYGSTSGAIGYNRSINQNWDVGLTFGSNGQYSVGSVHATYSW